MSGKNKFKNAPVFSSKKDFDVLLKNIHEGKIDLSSLDLSFLNQLPLYALQYCENPLYASEWVEYFYRHGAKPVPTPIDGQGRTALHWAVIRGEVGGYRTESYIKALLNEGKEGVNALYAMLNMQDSEGYTPLELALNKGDVPLFVELLKFIKDPISVGLLPKIVSHGSLKEEEKIALLEEVLKHKASVNEVDIKGDSVLINAISLKNNKVVDFLIKKGADVEQKTLEGLSPLLYSVKTGNREAVDLLIKKNVDVDQVDRTGKSALHHAVLLGDSQLVEFLLSKGASRDIQDEDGYTALHLAAKSKHSGIILESTPRLIENVKKLALDRTGRTALHWAISADNLRTANTLTQAFPDSLKILDTKGVSPLHLAVAHRDMDLVNRLLQKSKPDFNKNIKDRSGNTLLHLAALNDDVAMLQFLKEQGLDLNAQNNNGRTILHIFAEKGNYAMVERLKKEGVKDEIKDFDGKTAKNIAIDNGHASIAILLSNWWVRTFNRKSIEEKASKKTQAVTLEYERDQEIQKRRIMQYTDALKKGKLDTSGALLLMITAWEKEIPHFRLYEVKKAYVESDYKNAKNIILEAVRNKPELYDIATHAFSAAVKNDHAEKNASRRYFDTHLSVVLHFSENKKEKAMMLSFCKTLNIFSARDFKKMYNLWKSISPEQRAIFQSEGMGIFKQYRTFADQENTPPEDRYSQAPGILKANMPLSVSELSPEVKKNKGVDKSRTIAPSDFAATHAYIPVVGGVKTEPLYVMVGILQSYLAKKFHKKGKRIKLSNNEKQKISAELHVVVKRLSAYMVQKGMNSFGEITETLRSEAVQALFSQYDIALNLDFTSLNRNKIFSDAAFYANQLASKTELNEKIKQDKITKKATRVSGANDFVREQKKGRVVLADQPHTVLKNSVYDLKWVGEICELNGNYNLKDNIMLFPDRLALLHITAYVESEIQRDPYAEIPESTDDLKKMISQHYYPQMLEYLSSSKGKKTIAQAQAEVEDLVNIALKKGKGGAFKDRTYTQERMNEVIGYASKLRERLGSIGQYIEDVDARQVLEKALRTKIYNEVMNLRMSEIAERVGYEVAKQNDHSKLNSVFLEDRHTFYVVGSKGTDRATATGFAYVLAVQNGIDCKDLVKPTLQHTGEVIGLGYHFEAPEQQRQAFTDFESSMVHDLVFKRHQQNLEEDGHHAVWEVDVLTPELVQNGLLNDGQAHAVIVSNNVDSLKSACDFVGECLEFQVLQNEDPLDDYPKFVINADCEAKIAIVDHELAKTFYGEHYNTVINQLKESGFKVMTQEEHEEDFSAEDALNITMEDVSPLDGLPKYDPTGNETRRQLALDIALDDMAVPRDNVVDEEDITLQLEEMYANPAAVTIDPDGAAKTQQKLVKQLKHQKNAPPTSYETPTIMKGLDITDSDETPPLSSSRKRT